MSDNARPTAFLMGSAVRMFAVLFLGGAAVFPYARSTVLSRAAASDAVGGTPSAAAPSTPSGAEAPDTQTDALTLLAQFVGIDVSDSAVLTRAARAAGDALAASLPCVTLDEVRGALGELKQRASPPHRERMLGELRRIVQSRHKPGYCPSTPIETRADSTEPFPDDADDYVRLERNALRRTRVKAALQLQTIKDLEFIVATVPDPIDSNARWTFDGIAGAIQSAAAANDFVLDRFYIPDWDPSRDAGGIPATLSRTVHERWPAVVLFRHSKFGSDPDTRRLLLVSLVFETPTAGIHRVALRNALDTVADWQGDSVCASIDILGPSFSGSVPSLAMAIADFKTDHRCAAFRVVTGGATNGNNKAIIEGAAGQPTPSFQSTVLPDRFVQEKTVEFLLEGDPQLARGPSLALLVEDNTTYGTGLQDQAGLSSQAPTKAGTAPALSTAGITSPAVLFDCAAAGTQEKTAAEAREKQASCVLDHARTFPFPLHISRLRSEAQGQTRTPARTGDGGTGFLTFSLDEPGNATDQVPSLSPKSTSASVELVLANILDTIARERITTIGLLATDTRDKLFLAEQVARWNASVRLFTIESDLFYAHPDYGTYVRGMIVASTYPLFSQSQRWMSGINTQIQFPTTNTQGVYNALIALLRDPAGNVRPGRRRRDPLDYADPDAKAQRPPVWIGVVGRNGIWPIKWYPSTAEAATTYLQPMSMSAKDASFRPVVHASRAVNFSFFVLSLIVAAHVLAYFFRNTLGASHRTSFFLEFFVEPGLKRRRPYLLVAFSALTILYGYAAYVFLPFVVDPQPGFDRVWLLLVAAVSGGLLVSLSACAAHTAWHAVQGIRQRMRSWHANVLADPQYWLMLISAVCVIVAVWSGLEYLLVDMNLGTAHAVYYFERVTHPANAVSPLMPLVFVVATVYLWAAVHLRRLSTVSGEAIADSFRPLTGLRLEGLASASGNLQRFIDSAVQALPRWLTCAVLAATVVAGYVATVHPLASPEPVAFTRAFRAAWLLLQVLILITFAHVIYFWLLLRQVMEPFDGTPMVAAFDRLPVHLVRDRLSPEHPGDADVRRLTRFANQLGHAMTDILERSAHKPALRAEFGLDEERYRQTARLLSLEMSSPVPRGATWAESDAWRWLLDVARHLVDPVSTFWRTRMRESVLSAADFDSEIQNIAGDAQRWFLRAEDFLAMQALLLIRELLARLANIFFYIIAGVLLMVAAAQSFPFLPRQELLGSAWVYVISAVVLVVTIFFQMERDPVLSAIASTDAGKIRWDAALWSKLFLYGVVPVATVFAAQFPQIGNTILDWLRPVQGALP